VADEQIVTSIVAKADLSSLVSEVHRATASLQQLQRELVTSNKSIASATKIANNMFRDTLVGSGMYSSHFVNLQSDVDKFGKNLDAGRLKLRDYFSTFRTHARTSKGLIRELAQEQVMLQNAVMQPLGRNAQGLMQYNVMIPRGLDSVRNGTQLARMELQIMNRALSEGATSLINWGKNTQWAGRQLTVGLTVPLAMFGSQAARAFREADQELTRLVKVYGDIAGTASADLKKIRQDVVDTSKELSNAMGVNFKETIGLAADIAATGQQGEQLLSSLKETTRLAVLGEVDRAEAMKATLAIQTAFKSNTQELTESINFLNAVENQTSTTLNDLVEAIPKAGTVVKQLGGDVQDLALYLTAMREGGVNASEAANALKSGLASMINPTKQTVAVMSEFGIDIMGLVQQNVGNTTGMIVGLQKALDGLDPLSKARALEQMFGKFQFARMAALFNNLGKEGSQTLQVMNLMNASASQLAEIAGRELTLVTESASGKYKRAIEGLRASLADVGEDFLGVATKFINAFTKVLDFFTNLPEPIKKAVTYLGGFTAVIGPIIMLTGVLANFFGYVTKGIVSLKALFQGSKGWKMLTPEIIAAEKASQMVEKAFYSDAKAAEVLHGALTKLVGDYMNLQSAMAKGTIPVNPAVTTVAGSTVMAGGRRVVDPNDPYSGDLNTRAMSHINPRDPNNPATFLGGVPGAIPVNQKIGRTPQIYMHERLPGIPGLTEVKGVSTGIVSGEAARYHALLSTLAMQTEAEVATLKKTIALGGTVSSELLDTFDDILPITTRLADNAATQSAAIVSQLRAGKMTVDQAKAEIIAINAQLESAMRAELGAFAAARGRTIDFTKAPLMNQPVVDANGQFTLRDLYKKEGNRAVMEEFGRLRGVRTFGAPYSIQTTRLPKFNDGGMVESFGPNKTTVSGSTSINYDDRLGTVPLGGYVLNQGASLDPQNKDLIAMAPYTFEGGGEITAALTPGEVVFGPKINRIPGLYDALEAANNGYNFGGQVMKNKGNYGEKYRETPAYYRKQLGQLVKFIKNPFYEDSVRMRMVMLDAAELMEYAGMPKDQAVKVAFDNFNAAKTKSGGNLDSFIKHRINQVKDLEKKYPKLSHPNRAATRTPSSSALNKHIFMLQKFMADDPRFANVSNELKQMKLFDPKVLNTGGVPYLEMRDDQGTKVGVARGHLLRHDQVGHATRGHMGVAAVIDSELNSLMNRLDQIKLRGDVLHLTKADAEQSLSDMIKKAGMSRMTTLDDIAVALSDPGNRFPSKKELADIKAGKALPSRATPQQKQSLKMLLQAITERKRWVMVPRGRPPIMTPVLASFNSGGSIPGGSISGGRRNYGNIVPLLTPEKILRVLNTSKQLSSKKSLGEFSNLPVTPYSHQIAPSSGKSYPIPGVSGVYRNENGELVFLKGVPNAITAKSEMYGTRMSREVFGLDSPVQTVRAVKNPYDPSGKSKLLGLESPFDPKFAAGGTKFTEDQMIRQTIASLLLGNKDLSKSNVFGNVLADVGPAGVFPRASMNTEYAASMNSMEKQAMINLLAVRGGARKDFAYNTAPVAAGMSPRQYGAKMKAAMKAMHPKLRAFINSLPESDRAPYISMLSRLEDGMNVNWSKYQPIHANPAFNRGGLIGGGRIVSGRSNYGRPGNPAARAKWEAEQRQKRIREMEAERSRAASHQIYGQQALTTGLGREAVRQGTTSFYNPGAYLRSSLIDPFTSRLAQQAQYMQAVIKNAGVALKQGMNALAIQSLASAKYAVASFKSAGVSLANGMKSYVTDSAAIIKRGIDKTTQILRRGATHDFAKMGYYNATPSMLPPHLQHLAGAKNALQRYIGPVGLTAWTPQVGAEGAMRMHDGKEVLSRKAGPLGFRREQIALRDAATGQVTQMSASAARAAGLSAPTAMQRFQGAMSRGGSSMGMNMGASMAGMAAGSALMAKGQTGLGMAVMMGGSMLPMMLPGIGKGIAGVGKGLTAMKGAFSSAGASASTFAKVMNVLRVVLSKALFVGPLAGIAALTVGIGVLIKKTREWNRDAQLRFGMNAKAAEQAGIQYTSLADKMKLIAQRQTQLQNAGKSGMGGISGLNMSMEELKQAKEFAKENMGEFVASFDRADASNIAELATNIKAQFIAAGMSVEEANKKIMGMIAASKNSKLAINVMTNSAFAGVKDSSTAAEYSVKHLSQTIKAGDKEVDQYKTKVIEGMSSVIDLTDKSIVSISGQKNALGEVKGEYAALVEVTNKMKSQGFDQVVGIEAFQKLPSELQAIAKESDTIAGIYAKWRLYVKGVQVDLKGLSSETAAQLDRYLTAFTAAQDKLIDAGKKAFSSGLGLSGMDGTFKQIGFTMANLQSIIDKTGREAALAQQKASRAAEDQNEKLQKQIDLIREAANEKLKALDATEKRESYELQIQKARLDYQAAIAKGDFQTAERARLDLIQLQKTYQAEQARLAIQEDAARKEKALQDQQKKNAEEEKKRQREFQDAQAEAARAQEAMAKIQNYTQQYKDLLLQKQTNEFIQDPKLRVDAQRQTDNQLKSLVKEIQAAGLVTKGNKGFDIAGDIKKAFGKFFDSSGKALNFDSVSQAPTYDPKTGLQLNSVFTKGKMGDVLNRDLELVRSQAMLITGGMTIKQLAESISRDMGNQFTPTGSAGVTVNPGTKPKDVSKSKDLYTAARDAEAGAKQPERVEIDGIVYNVFTYKGKRYASPVGSTGEVYDYSDVLKTKGNRVKNFVTGGAVTGPGTGTSDSIPAMLSNGEYVINAASAANIGYENLDRLNRMKDGGPVGRFGAGGDPDLKNIFGMNLEMGTKSAMLRVAEKAIGYIEKATNNPVAKALTGAISRVLPSFDLWCGRFINWVSSLAGVKIPNVVGTAAGYSSFRSKKRLYQNPEPGDLVFFDFGRNKNITDHVGLVSRIVSKNVIRTIEGNTSGSNQTNGGMVAVKNRKFGPYNPRAGIYTRGFGRPDYRDATKTTDLVGGDLAPHNLGNAKDYSVNRGDTLFGIARRFGVSLNSIIKANPQLTENSKYMGGFRLFKGTDIRIPRFATGGTVGNPPRRMYSTAGPVMGNVTIGDIVINAAPGMDERALARAAAQEVFAVMSNRNLQMGGQVKVIR
jgi:TP901 family phage tail tape measure protein